MMGGEEPGVRRTRVEVGEEARSTMVVGVPVPLVRVMTEAGASSAAAVVARSSPGPWGEVEGGETGCMCWPPPLAAAAAAAVLLLGWVVQEGHSVGR